MRKSPIQRLEEFRIRTGPLASDASRGANGAFMVPCAGVLLMVVASDGSDWGKCGLPGKPWEHVSVSLQRRCPTWEEMEHIKRSFWHGDETVVQFHVPANQHISEHKYCLHLWKPPYPLALPPSDTVGRQTAIPCPKGDSADD